ncbi:DUF3293 domain-containing protein [Photobacterium profundum]|uniref:DUF3293 domain-containing protein n=1 Tax=Photobacterium profundum TaxID=74109 RepID=UPI003D0F3747
MNQRKCKKNSLWRKYQNITFEARQHPVYHCFAILTAFNPRSIVLTHSDNVIRNIALEKNLIMLTNAWMPICCRSLDQRWVEQSFAVHLPLEQVSKLAVMFEQNAIYWVENNELYLVPILLEGIETQKLGKWSTFFYT